MSFGYCRYRFLKFLPLYQLFPGRFYIAMTHAARPFVEPDFRREKQLFRQMTDDKDPVFMKRAISLIVNGYAKEVLNKLPMEFAVEAGKLLEVSLEGAVG